MPPTETRELLHRRVRIDWQSTQGLHRELEIDERRIARLKSEPAEPAYRGLLEALRLTVADNQTDPAERPSV